MTKAYFVLEKNGLPEDSVYVSSDGYPSGEMAKTMLLAFRDGRFAEALKEHHQESGYKDVVAGLEPHMYRGKDVQWVDYSYVLRGSTLHLYCSGQHAAAIKAQDVDIWMEAIRMEDILYQYLGYNGISLSNQLNSVMYYSALSKRIRNGIVTAGKKDFQILSLAANMILQMSVFATGTGSSDILIPKEVSICRMIFY